MMERQYQSVRSYLNATAPPDAAAFFNLVVGPEARNIRRNLFGRLARLDRAAVLDLLQLAENIYTDTAYMQSPTPAFAHPSARYLTTLDRMRQLLIGVLDPQVRQVLNSIMARIESLLRQQIVNEVEITTLCGDFYEEYARYVSRQHYAPPPGAYSGPQTAEFMPQLYQALPQPEAYPPPPQPEAYPIPPQPEAYPPPPQPEAYPRPPQPEAYPTPPPPPYPPQATLQPHQEDRLPLPLPTQGLPTPPPSNAEKSSPGTFSRLTNEFTYTSFAQQNEPVPENQPAALTKPLVPTKPPHLQSKPNSAGVPTAAPPPPNMPPPPPNMPPPLDDLLLDAIMSEPRKGEPDRGALFDQIKKGATLKKIETPNAPTDTRGDLLNQIKMGTTLKKTGRLKDGNLENLSNTNAGNSSTKTAPTVIFGALYDTIGERRSATALSDESDLLSESASGYDEPDTQIQRASKGDLKFAVHLFNFAKDSKLFNIQNVTNKKLEKILQTASGLLRKRPRTVENVEKAKNDLRLFSKSVQLTENALDSQSPVELYAANAPQFYVQIEDLIFAGRYDDVRAFVQAVDAPDDLKLKNLLRVANELSAN
ncbi:viral capsid associated protein [Samia ricini nucleopolyhedrovirus]|nr:viral capsid associated protein [Samia ricini nucleopolyhedrovirus]BBD51216.1 viral capsid associated protein [Samia ricini nucleopolyhedrovirus]BBD51368.1 viral capsid associated protein [Samia ricini nucleopolyhedrovirus]